MVAHRAKEDTVNGESEKKIVVAPINAAADSVWQ